MVYETNSPAWAGIARASIGFEQSSHLTTCRVSAEMEKGVEVKMAMSDGFARVGGGEESLSC